MEALDKKIEEMLSAMENRVEVMHEHASTAANLKDDVASLRDGVRTVAATASDTCQALSEALKGFVETHNAALLRDSSAFEEVAGKAGASLEAASDRASAAAKAFEKNANSLIEALHAQAEVLTSASQKNIEAVEELKLIARELKVVQETGLKNLEAALGERIHTTLEEKSAEQRDMIARKLERQLNDFEKKSGAELDKQLKKVTRETESSIQKSVNWATFAAVAASAGLLVSLLGRFVG